MAQKASKRAFDNISFSLSRRTQYTIKYMFLFVFSCFFAEQAQAALSSVCQQINTDLSGAGLYDATNSSQHENYENVVFNAGETLTWTATLTGTGVNGDNATATAEDSTGDVAFTVTNNASVGDASGTFTGSYTYPANTASDYAIYFYLTTGDNGNNTASLRVTCSSEAPSANAVSATVTANSSANAITLNITGEAATSVAVASQPSHGTATASGASITYTPTSGYSGTDSFTYTATNGSGTSSAATVSITVSAPTPAISSISPTSGSINGGTSISITGTDLSSVTSVKFGTTVASSFSVNSATSITVPAPAHAVGAVDIIVSDGTNTSTLSNAFTYTATVPDAPTIGTATTGNGQATVSFTAPASNGGAAITSYTVTSSPDGKTATGTTSPITVTGLTNGTAYTFTVTATNSVGTGAASSASSSVTPTAPVAVPDAPTIGTATAGNGQATVSFTAPASNGGAAISSYTVTASPGGATATGTTSPITVTGLTNGTVYTFTVKATNSVGDSAASSASSSVTPTAPVAVPDAPTIGTATAGNGQATVSFTAPASNGGAAITSYTVTSNPDGKTATGTTSPITVTGLTNGTAYTFTVTATNSVGTGAASSASSAVTPTVSLQAPVANTVSATVAANSSANAITLSITGGTADSVAVASAASHGTATASGTSISYTPTTGYSGTDSFTYTATNTSGTSAAATVSITVSAPTFTFSPSAGTLAAGTTGTSYSQTITASGGSGTYSYAVSGTLPAGVSLNTSTGVVSGMPTSAGNYSFTITATDANSFTGSAAYTLAIAVQAPVANAVSASVAANSSGNDIPLTITGGAATSVLVDTQASHGTATASGTTISYTPTTGYSGADSFTYTATNASGTSSPATVSITVSAASFTFSPSASALTSGTVGTAYSQVIAASDGTAPYNYLVTSGSLPAGLNLHPTTGVISGTPTTAANASFTITATDANAATSSVAYTLNVSAPVASLVFSPSAGSLTDAMAGEKYEQEITVSGGAAPLTFSVISGSLPNGLTLSTSGLLSGTLAANTQNDYVFEVRVTDAQNSSATALYNLKVKERTVAVESQTITVPAGSAPTDARLDKNATGGPFDSGQLVSVVPSNAGTAALTMGDYAQSGPVSPVGWYLKFTPATGYSGTVVITFSLTSGLGSSTGTVTYNLGYNPAEVATEIDGYVRDFVKSRQSMISSTIKVPGLLERRNAETAGEPVTTRMSPSSNGMTLGFSTSLAQIEAYRNGAVDASGRSIGGVSSSPFNVWLSGAFLMHKRDDDDSRWGSFGMVSAGADYLITEKALVGVSFHLDRMTDPTDADAELTGNGWLVGPYSSLEIGKGVYWDTSILYGGSANDIDTAFWDGSFDTKRWMADTAIKGQWRLDEVTVLTPKLRAVYFSEEVDDYTVSNAAGDALTLDGFTTEQLRVSLGAEIARKFTLSNETKLTPKIGLTGGFAGLDGSGAFGTVSTGISLETASDWNLDFSLLFNVEGGGDKSGGARARVSKRF